MYRLKDIAIMTGLSERTVRNHMESGHLHGELTDGIWLFTEEEVSSYMADPYVSPAIRTKRNAIVFDYMAERNNADDEMCVLFRRKASLEEAKRISEFFCRKASESGHIRFSCDYREEKAQIILKGHSDEVSCILNEYSNTFPVPLN